MGGPAKHATHICAELQCMMDMLEAGYKTGTWYYEYNIHPRPFPFRVRTRGRDRDELRGTYCARLVINL